jgi:predicted enzyme related to lactoylglutathione lyase
LGGVVTKQITNMPNGGRYALLEDPQGAGFGVYESTSDHGPEKAAKRGEHSWHELATDDYQAAFDFYSALFGWEETGQHDMGAPVGVYFMFGRNGVSLGGIFNRMPEMPPPAWTPYVRVRDTQKAVNKATAEGATLLTGPMEVPGGDWIAQLADPQGAIFAVHTVLADVKGAPAQQAANEESVTPEEAGEKRHEEVVNASAALEEVSAKQAPRKTSRRVAKAAQKTPAAKAAKRPAKAAVKKAKSAKQATKGGGKKTSKKASKKASKTKVVAKKAAKTKASRKKVAKQKVAKKKVAKKKGTGRGSKRATTQRKSAARTTKRPASKSAKAKRPSAQRSQKKAAKRPRRAK